MLFHIVLFHMQCTQHVAQQMNILYRFFLLDFTVNS